MAHSLTEPLPANSAQFHFQALLLHRHCLLLAGGVDQHHLHLVTMVPELFLTRMEVTLLGLLTGGHLS